MTSKVLDIAERRGAQAGPTEQVGTNERAQKRAEPWDGSLADHELAMPGGLLLGALSSCASDRGHQFNQMAAELGVTYGYIAQLRNGTREVSQISDDFARACANYLMVPRMTVLMLAGRITPEDFFESHEAMVSEVTRAFEYVCADPKWGPLITAEVRLGNVNSHFGVVRLYEGATGKTLMPRALKAETLAEEVSKLRDIQIERRAQVAQKADARKRGPRPKKVQEVLETA